MAEGPLTERELEIVRLVADGLSNQQIAAALDRSKRTVDAHVRNAKKKTQTRTRTQLAVYALRAQLVALSPERDTAVPDESGTGS